MTRPWYASGRGRLVHGSIGGEWWASWTTYFLASLSRGTQLPAGRRGFLLDAIGAKNDDTFLLLLMVVCSVHFVLLAVPNLPPWTIAIRKVGLVLEGLCWTSVAFDLFTAHQYGSLIGLVPLVALMVVGVCRKRYPNL